MSYWARDARYDYDKRFGGMTREQQNQHYDKHNPGSRFSEHVMQRLHGKCGCKFCIDYRAAYVDAGLVSPVNERGTNMASVNLCDRCGSMVQGLALGSVQVRTSSDPDTSEVVSKEVCPDCVSAVLGVVEMEGVEPSQRGYRKPFQRENTGDDVESATAEQLAAALFQKLMKDENNRKQIEG